MAGSGRRAAWQAPLEELDERDPEVLVVGGGPAGSTAALHLARRGRRVLLAERARYPRDKACGDLLIPDSLGALRRAGLYDEVRDVARTVDEALVSSPSRIEWRIPGEYMAAKRLELDEILARGAAARGARVCHGRVEDLRVDADGSVTASFQRSAVTVRARVAVLATGADVSLAQRLGMVGRPAPTAVAVRSYVRSGALVDPLVISFDRGIVPGYGWIFPLRDGEYNVGCGVLYEEGRSDRYDLRGLYDVFVRGFPLARHLLERSEGSTPLRGARLRCGLHGTRARGPGNVLAIGETIGATYPFTGEGIGKAMETGELAAEVVEEALRGDVPTVLDRFEERLDRELRPRYRGYAAAERWLSRWWLNDLVAWRIRRSSYLQGAVAGMVSETADPGEVFSARGFVRSLFR